MPYRIAVMDDNATDVEYVIYLVKRWAAERNIAVQLESFSSAEVFLFTYDEDKEWDILLLDIEMGGKNGLELARIIRQDNENAQLIFITGFPDFIAEGYEVSALHYLMKPVPEEKLHAVLDKAVANLAKSEKRLCITFDRQTDYVAMNRSVVLTTGEEVPISRRMAEKIGKEIIRLP